MSAALIAGIPDNAEFGPVELWLTTVLLLWVFCVVRFVGRGLRDRCTRGAILLDCGRYPGRIPLVAALLLFLAYVLYHDLGSRRSDLLWWWSPLLLAALALLAFSTVLGRLLVYENGIWYYSTLIRWNRIRCYRWIEGSKLLITGTEVLSTYEVAVPPEHRQAVDDFLAQYCHTSGLPPRRIPTLMGAMGRGIGQLIRGFRDRNREHS
jgi:hypothetical protein